MEQAVEKSRGDDGVAEDLAPFGEAAVGGEDHGAAFVTGIDELKEEVAAACHDRQVADLVDDEESEAAEEAEAFGEPAFALGAGEPCDQVGERGEVDASTRLDGFHAESGRQVALAGAGWPEKMNDFRALNEAEAGEREDAVTVERGREGKSRSPRLS